MSGLVAACSPDATLGPASLNRRILRHDYQGTILHSSDGGSTWVQQPSGTSNLLVAIDFVDDQYGWITGAFGAIYHTDNGGVSWSSQDSNSIRLLTQPHFHSRDVGWIVGEDGAILKTVTGGNET